jgi:type III pantothenate kinase
MSRTPQEDLGPLSIVVLDIGNSKTAIARWLEGTIEDRERVPTVDQSAIVTALATVRARAENPKRQAIVISSVVPDTTAWLQRHIEEELDLRAFVVGDNTPLPMEVDLPDPSQVGVDRVCGAAAAYSRVEGACVVIDAGTALTINAVDDDGVFRGGAILPGLTLQAEALSKSTAQLPLIDPAVPQSAVGRTTQEAITSGLIFGMVGAIRGIVEQIATEWNHWPHTVLTGGGGARLRDRLDFVDTWAPDLCLMGVGLAYMKRIEQMAGGEA